MRMLFCRICYWIVLATPFWLLRQRWYYEPILPYAGEYGYSDDGASD